MPRGNWRYCGGTGWAAARHRENLRRRLYGAFREESFAPRKYSGGSPRKTGGAQNGPHRLITLGSPVQWRVTATRVPHNAAVPQRNTICRPPTPKSVATLRYRPAMLSPEGMPPAQSTGSLG